MSNIYDGGAEVDRRVRQYQVEHPGTSYSAALRALMREEDAQEEQLHQEFDRRVKAYSSEFPDADPAELVAKHDDSMMDAYAETGADVALAKRIGEIWQQAKQDTAGGKVSMSDAVQRILESDKPAAQKIAGDWLSATALKEINNMNMGSSIKEAFPRAFAAVRRTYSEVDQQYQTGRVSELSMRTIFRQWFRD